MASTVDVKAFIDERSISAYQWFSPRPHTPPSLPRWRCCVCLRVSAWAPPPNTTTLLSEYAPQRRRSLVITIVFTGFNLGSAAIGFAADAGDPSDLCSDRDGRRTLYTNGGIRARRFRDRSKISFKKTMPLCTDIMPD
jgi:hypothetical protein